MNVTLLQHDGRLGVHDGAAGPVPAGWSPPHPDTHVVSFRPPAQGGPVAVIGGVNATTRFLQPLGDHVAFYGLESVGGTVTLAGDGSGAPYLARGYYRDALTVEAADPKAGQTTFRKVGPLPAELDRGLDRWTFGIPVGPGDATGLNAVVRRILEFGLPEAEILLCGRPGANFRYRDRVRVVGEDITGTPVPISAKKNRLAEEARYENLCILHDRVFLPKDFPAAVRAFGDLFPFVCFQSLWFDDPYNLVGKRYSDYCRLLNPVPLLGDPADPGAGRAFQPGLFPEAERSGFVSANPLRYNQGNYCTGSLYMCKKRVWRACPQDGRLRWLQMEDVEHGLRGNALGVPHRVNPHAFSQSLFTRPQLLCRGLMYETSNGSMITSVNLMEEVRFRRKPLARVSVTDAHLKLQAFIAKWVPRHLRDMHAAELARPAGDAHTWGRQVAVAVYGAAVGFGEENVRAFLADYETHLVFDTFSDWTTRHLVEHFAIYGATAKDMLVEHGLVLSNMILYRTHGNLFYDSQAEYFPEPTRNLRYGTWFSARRMARHDGQLLHHPGGQPGYQQAILNSTPFRDYYEG